MKNNSYNNRLKRHYKVNQGMLLIKTMKIVYNYEYYIIKKMKAINYASGHIKLYNSIDWKQLIMKT